MCVHAHGCPCTPLEILIFVLLHSDSVYLYVRITLAIDGRGLNNGAHHVKEEQGNAV